MKLADINPHIRYCYEIFYKQSQGTVFVKDCRLMYPLSGTGILEIGNNTYKLKEGTIFYCSFPIHYVLNSIVHYVHLKRQFAEDVQVEEPLWFFHK